MTTDKRNKLITRAVVGFLVVVFVAGVGWGAKSLLSNEGTQPPEDIKTSLTPCPDGTAAIIEYLRYAESLSCAKKPKLESSVEYSTEEDTIEFDGETDGLLENVAKHIDENITDILETDVSIYEFDYGVGFDSSIIKFDFSEADIVSAQCLNTYYYCPECGEDYDELPTGECPDCGKAVEFEKKERDEYEIILEFENDAAPVDETSPLARNFSILTREELADLLKGEFDKYFTTDSLVFDYRDVKIVAKVNRFTDEIVSVNYHKEIFVTANITFTGELASLGKRTCSFALDDEYNYSFTYTAVELSEEILDMEKKSTEPLLATIYAPMGTEVTWSSSDETFATVDEDGYVSSNKELGSAVITASFELNGITYSDSCEVNVKVSADGISISNKRLSLNIGDSAELTATVKPKKATIKDVTWHTEDESIAIVDENGKVTAVGAGEVKVYALSVDGYYKASCKITVKEVSPNE